MKAKNLLLALAVPAAFAACSQEEFENDVQKVNDGRPVVGSIVLDIPEAAQTRWGWGSTTGFTFDENDYIGAALMDTYNSGVDTPTPRPWFTRYSIVNYISTNYKYGYKDGWSNNDAVMSEGNYFFYMPYNENLKSRAGLVYNIPVDQFAYDETAENPVAEETRSWKKNQMFIGYDDVTVEDQAAMPQMVELFAKPRFNINYIGSNGVKVERIVMRDATSEFNVAGVLTPKPAAAPAYNPITNPGASEVTNYGVAINKTLADAFMSYNKALANYTLKDGQSFINPLVGNEATFTTTTAGEKADAISLNFVPAARVSGLMVVPAGRHNLNAVNNLEFDIYTNKGLVTLGAATIDASGNLADANPGTELTYSNIDKLKVIKAGDGKKDNAVTINFGDRDVKVPANVTVSTTAQLESIMRWYADASVTASGDLLAASGVLTVTISGDEVVLTKKVYDIIKGNEALKVKFVGVLTIASDLASDAIMLVDSESAGATVIVVNEQTLSYTVNKQIKYDIEVDGGTLNVTTGTKTTTLANVTNYGTVNINGKVVAGTIDNFETLNVASGMTLTSEVNNKAYVDRTASYTTYTANAVIENEGTINLKGGLNQGVINNNNKIDIKADFENEVMATVVTTPGTNGFTGKINNKDASNSYIYSNAVFTNSGDIDNVGAIYSQGTGTIVNDGYIYAHDGAMTYVTTNNNEIELEKRDTETQVNTENGKVTYTMMDSDLTNGKFAFDATSDKFNTLKIGTDVTFAHANAAPDNIILQDKNLTVTCKSVAADELYVGSAPIGVAHFESITAKAGYRYIVKGVEVQSDKLVVEKGAIFQIPALSSFGMFPVAAPEALSGVNAIVENKGEILVGGEFYANFNGIKPTGGKLSSAGTGSYKLDYSNFTTTVNVKELTTSGVTAAGTYAVSGNVTIGKPAAAASVIGGGDVTITSTSTEWTANVLTVKSDEVKIILGTKAAPFKTGAASEPDDATFRGLITAGVADVTVRLIYSDNSAPAKTYYREYKWDGTSAWVAQGAAATEM